MNHGHSSAEEGRLQAIAAYVMRLWLDPSRIPTPLPPSPVAEPAE